MFRHLAVNEVMLCKPSLVVFRYICETIVYVRFIVDSGLRLTPFLSKKKFIISKIKARSAFSIMFVLVAPFPFWFLGSMGQRNWSIIWATLSFFPVVFLHPAPPVGSPLEEPPPSDKIKRTLTLGSLATPKHFQKEGLGSRTQPHFSRDAISQPLLSLGDTFPSPTSLVNM